MFRDFHATFGECDGIDEKRRSWPELCSQSSLFHYFHGTYLRKLPLAGCIVHDANLLTHWLDILEISCRSVQITVVPFHDFP